MRRLYFCPYCKHASYRRWNLSVHVIRKHKTEYNPFPDMRQKRQTIFFDDLAEPINPETSIPLPPKDEPSDPFYRIKKTIRLQNVINEINRMNRLELFIVLNEINKMIYNNTFR